MGYIVITLQPCDVYDNELVAMICIGQLVDTGWVKVTALARCLFITNLFAHLLSSLNPLLRSNTSH